jgi:hypothetical protein
MDGRPCLASAPPARRQSRRWFRGGTRFALSPVMRTLTMLLVGLAACSAPLDESDPATMMEDPTAAETPVGGSTVSPGGTTPAPSNPPATPPPVLKDISFSTQVLPIFTKRTCEGCHTEDGIGKDLGDFAMDGGAQHIYKEIAMEVSPTLKTPRVNLTAPEKSAILSYPLFETPANHPVAPFASTADPDYQILLTWIKEGARLN